MSLSLRLRQERAQIVELMHPLANSKSPADAQRWAQLDAQQEQLRQRIVTAEQGSLEDELAQVRGDVQRPNIGDWGPENQQRALTAQDQARSTPEYHRAWEAWARSGKESYETRALSSTGDGETLNLSALSAN